MLRIGTAMLAIVLAVLTGQPSGSAQVAQMQLEYGDSVRGEITAVAYETAYLFTGQAGDVIVVEMRSVDRSLLNPLIAPNLILRDPSNTIMVDTAAVYPIDDTTLVAELPEDGDYLLIATREGGPRGSSTGEFSLSLNLATMLAPDVPVSGAVAYSEGGIYFAIRGEAPLFVRFQRQSGDYAPRVSVNRIDAETGALSALAYAGGAALQDSCLGVHDIDATTTMIAIVPDADSFAFDDVRLEFTLLVSHAECATTR